MRTDVQELVRERYGEMARSQKPTGCCGEQAQGIGYTSEELHSIPEEANLGLGCGNPLALAEIGPGNTVLDLGSGAGLDCFLAWQKVGQDGFVIGVDMTPEMIEKASRNRAALGANNVDFRLGRIENLPVESGSVDLVISNCVINLSAHKPTVFREAFRVLREGGVLQISDIVLLRKLPRIIRKSVDAYTGCIAGAERREDYIAHVRAAGFTGIEILEARPVSKIFSGFMRHLAGIYAESVKLRAIKETKGPAR